MTTEWADAAATSGEAAAISQRFLISSWSPLQYTEQPVLEELLIERSWDFHREKRDSDRNQIFLETALQARLVTCVWHSIG